MSSSADSMVSGGGRGSAMGGSVGAIGSPHDLRATARSSGRTRFALLTPAWLCVLAAFGLTLLGLAAISTTAPEIASRQVAFVCLGVVIAAAVATVHYRVLEAFSPLLAFVVLLMLVFVLLPFVPESIVRPRNGARRWISIGVDVQPSELAKIAYILVLASYLRTRKHYRRLLGILRPMALTFIPMVLILKEPDLGTSLLFLPTLFAMLLAAGSRIRHLVLIIAIGLAAAPALYPVLAPHQKARITALAYQWRGDATLQQGIGYQGAKAMMLSGAGGVAGVGKDDGRSLVRYNRLPEEHNDMIFAVISVRWGLLGAIVTWGLYLMLCFGGILVAAASSDPYGRLVAIGIATMLFAQMVVNTGMTIGVLPITGMNLPFVSSGGSSLLSMWMMIGILISIGLRSPQFLSREARGFDSFDTEE